MCLDEWEESGCCSVLNYLHIAQSWPLTTIDKPKHPNFLACCTASVVLLHGIEEQFLYETDRHSE